MTDDTQEKDRAPEADALFDTLARELPTADVDDLRAQRIRARANAELVRAHRAAAPGWRRTVRRTYRHVELVLAGGLAASYLAWAIQAARLAYR